MTGTHTVPEVDRVAANRKAVEIRKKRAALKDELRSKGGHIELLELTKDSDACAPEAATMRVTDYLLTLPSIGPKKLEGLLARAGVSSKKRLGGLGHRQRESLSDVVGSVIHQTEKRTKIKV